ncbi:PKD domain-containing protein [Methanolacinia petrolearia DSM 11571]|uniref:PKD domain-containing protein n=1 Tax=Methanolacinia petrolearia (strain DSM 11571 / OCM 486 / SEBR 4847) TaxID=679926 RepID=E1RFF9_METP4|nr:PKD domain-containing protein [Methanolacinia petrolearia]ADN36189.1 PKD domain-containing protein [Methanolacinia petrolearia DSM 11571]
MIKIKPKWIIPVLLLASALLLGAVFTGLMPSSVNTKAGSHENTGLPVMQGQFDSLVLDTVLPTSPEVMAVYKIRSIDLVQDGDETKAFSIKKTIPSAAEAPALAEKALEKYGGLSEDAKFVDAVPRYLNKYNLTTDSVEEQYPMRTQVRYIQILNELPVIGASINLDLGEDGEIINIIKAWPKYEQTGEVTVISAENAYEKLRNSETIDRLQGSIPEGTKITKITPGYKLYNAWNQNSEPFLKPVWIFYAVTSFDPEPFPLMVDATA